jgi:hypothetical protein
MGFSQLWKGVSAAVTRQVLTAAIRTNVYGPLVYAAAAKDRYHSVSMMSRATYSCAVGALAAFITSPLDLVLVRMQTDHLLDPEFRRNYTGVVDGLYKIMATSNYNGLYVGALPNVARAAALTGGMMDTYDLFKEFYAKDAGDVVGVKLIAAARLSLCQ